MPRTTSESKKSWQRPSEALERVADTVRRKLVVTL